MNRKNIYSVILALLAVNMVYGQMAQDRLYYIEKFSKIAQEEMERTGVPASIKLAQAILESNGGKSVLSRKAHNHFGIKCGGSWNDRTFYRVDDEKDKKGNDIESCFRVYKNAESSFIAHSEFLRDNKRYEFLFSLDHDDYKAWAHGLKKAGYATNPKYPSLLIKLIEDYSLFQYDDLFIPSDDAILVSKEEDVFYEELARNEKRQANVTKTGKLNDINVFFAQEGETPEAIAAQTDVSLRRILKYNENLTDSNQSLSENRIVFLQPKRKAYRGRKKFHKVSDGETIAQISQKYGIRADKLLIRNRLSANQEPLPGAILKIKGRKVAQNSRIPTREVGEIGNRDVAGKKQSSKFSTALSDFELPPSIEEEKKLNRKRKNLNLNKNKKDHVEDGMVSKPKPNRIEKSKTSTSSYLEESKEDNAVYRAPITSNNYNTYDSSSNAKFKEEKIEVAPSSQPSPTIETNRTDNTIGMDKQSTSNSEVVTRPSAPLSSTIPSTTATSPRVSNPVSSSPVPNNPIPSSSTPSASVPSNSIPNNLVPSTTITTIPSTQTVEIRYHVVEKGQTLYRLSKIYGKPVDYIKQVNGLTGNTISIGQKLIVN